MAEQLSEILRTVVGFYEIAGIRHTRLSCGHIGSWCEQIGTAQRCRKCEAARQADGHGYAPRMAPVGTEGMR